MDKFKSFTEFEDFVKQTRSEYLEQTERFFSADTNPNRFLVQLNTNLKDRGFEILKSDPVPPEPDAHTQIKIRLIKGGINPSRLEEYDKVIQRYVDDIENAGK